MAKEVLHSLVDLRTREAFSKAGSAIFGGQNKRTQMLNGIGISLFEQINRYEAAHGPMPRMLAVVTLVEDDGTHDKDDIRVVANRTTQEALEFAERSE